MKNVLRCALPALILMSGTAPSLAQEGHSMHDHGSMAGSTDEAMGMGTLHGIDADGKLVNISHEPIEALNWPKMTMDLPVTNRVDLSVFKPGDAVHFTLKKGRDNQFRIIAMEPVPPSDSGGQGDKHQH